MKIKYAFEIVDMGEEKIAVPVGKEAESLHGVIKLNKQGYEIFKQLLDGRTETEIINALNEKYDDDLQTIKMYYEEFINTLAEIKIVE